MGGLRQRKVPNSTTLSHNSRESKLECHLKQTPEYISKVRTTILGYRRFGIAVSEQ